LGWIVAQLIVIALLAVLIVVFGHRGFIAASSFVFPGIGLVGTEPALAGLFMALSILAAIAWLRWGADWLFAVVVAASMVASGLWGVHGHSSARSHAARASHQFPVVVLVADLLSRLRAKLATAPGFRWLRGRQFVGTETRRLVDLDPADRCRAVAVMALAGEASPEAVAAVRRPDVARRARLVGLIARFRFGGDPFRVDHAHARAAFSLTEDLDVVAQQRFVDDAARSYAGVPASEPGWVRFLDATLAAAALEERGEPTSAKRWRTMLRGPFALRHGHRPAWMWLPIGYAGGRSPDWEQAAASAIAYSRGWIDRDDWPAMRQRVMGAAARGVSRREDERLIAAGRVWLAMIDDPSAERIVRRPTVRHDPLAVALDGLADHLRHGLAPATS
jgi:hypothetical protein